MRVLVTGITEPSGRAVARMLLAAGHEVVGLTAGGIATSIPGCSSSLEILSMPESAPERSTDVPALCIWPTPGCPRSLTQHAKLMRAW